MLYVIPTPMPSRAPGVAQMPDLPDLSASLSGIFGAVLLVIAGLAWRRAVNWFSQIMVDVKVAKEQTTNSHGTNLRDDITCIDNKVDDLSEESRKTNEAVRFLAESQRMAHEDIRELRRDFRMAIEYVRDVDKRTARTD